MLHRIGGPVFYINEDGYPCWAHEDGAKELVCYEGIIPTTNYEKAIKIIEMGYPSRHVYVGQQTRSNKEDITVMMYVGEQI
ncbi:hypothetical protein F485_gp188 [Aeromonas phage CC2]|uniref:Uncharacterized protein n=1 Tax=Aeromonas phage CC2 TaxID=1204516 RepID=I6WBB3_9CAUD|nr:hypothetical protein F485_gp188 [Aeromonas phage CC2]AFN39220.1 hypothetical protein CC2_107 [Aeromonas phage CC2]